MEGNWGHQSHHAVLCEVHTKSKLKNVIVVFFSWMGVISILLRRNEHSARYLFFTDNYWNKNKKVFKIFMQMLGFGQNEAKMKFAGNLILSAKWDAKCSIFAIVAYSTYKI
jgi:hypothetical protein